MDKAPLLDIQNLSIDFKTSEALVHAVKDVSFKIDYGKTVGLVGESGSGKSVTSLATMQLIPTPPGIYTQGKILFKGEDILKKSEADMRQIRGNNISMIFQEPMTSLNPVFTVGNQISEVLTLHQGMTKKQAWNRSVELLDQVGIPNPSVKAKAYPHEMSGGQKQRVMIAMAIGCSPDLLIADEPTTALDVTIQKQVLELILKLQEDYKMGVLFITHDLGVVADIADDVVVMYRGDIVERGDVAQVFNKAKHPYTKGLIACRPSLTKRPERLPTVSDFMDEQGKELDFDASKVPEKKVRSFMDAEVVLEVKGLKKYFPIRKSFFGKTMEYVKAVDEVDFKVFKGQTLGLVGESGCGKTTLGRTILRLLEPTEGQIIFHGQDITQLSSKEMLEMRKKIQIIFQDPYSSLNPRMSVGAALTEPMKIHGIGRNKAERKAKAIELLEEVGLGGAVYSRYPHEFSGGQRQRICIARALAVEPEFIICDESVSALDVSIQAQVLNLLLDLQEKKNLTYIFISHDLSVVRFISDHVVVMNSGKIVEMASSEEIYDNPQQEYTRDLLSAIPKGEPGYFRKSLRS